MYKSIFSYLLFIQLFNHITPYPQQGQSSGECSGQWTSCISGQKSDLNTVCSTAGFSGTIAQERKGCLELQGYGYQYCCSPQNSLNPAQNFQAGQAGNVGTNTDTVGQNQNQNGGAQSTNANGGKPDASDGQYHPELENGGSFSSNSKIQKSSYHDYAENASYVDKGDGQGMKKVGGYVGQHSYEGGKVEKIQTAVGPDGKLQSFVASEDKKENRNEFQGSLGQDGKINYTASADATGGKKVLSLDGYKGEGSYSETNTHSNITVSGTTESGICSYYGEPGEVPEGHPTGCPDMTFKRAAMSCAHKTLPCGTLIKVTNESNGKSVQVEVTDRGPFVDGRILDLTKTAFEAIADTKVGITSCSLSVVS